MNDATVSRIMRMNLYFSCFLCVANFADLIFWHYLSARMVWGFLVFSIALSVFCAIYQGIKYRRTNKEMNEEMEAKFRAFQKENERMLNDLRERTAVGAPESRPPNLH